MQFTPCKFSQQTAGQTRLQRLVVFEVRLPLMPQPDGVDEQGDPPGTARSAKGSVAGVCRKTPNQRFWHAIGERLS